MKLLKNYFTSGMEEAEALADVFHRDGEQALEATCKGQAEAYRICLNFYGRVNEDLKKFIEGMELAMEFYEKIYLVEEDSMCYHKRYYSGLYLELVLIINKIYRRSKVIKLVTEIWDIEDFEAWSGGKDTLQEVIEEGKSRELQELLEAMCYDTWTDMELNDFLWFDRDYIYECLNIEY